MKLRNLFMGFFVVLLLVFVSGCTSQKISDIKSSDYVGKQVRVTGTAQGVVKIGSLSGYTLKDDTGSIGVQSENLPAEGETVTVKGTLMKDSILGYYIKVD